MTSEPLPHIERVEIIKGYAAMFDLHCFVETGTAEGFTVSNVLDTFNSITTIELDLDLVHRAIERFKIWPHVVPVYGDSGEVLPKLVPGLTQPTLFWLDGHWSGGRVRGPIDTPIVAELTAVVHAPKGSVILIDDMRLFNGMEHHTAEFHDYPHIDWIRDFVGMYDFHFEIGDDIGRCTPTNV